MKKRRLFPFAIISLLLILAFLNFTSPKNAEKINLPSLEEKEMKDLTKDKYIEDFEFAYNILETYYPYFDINKKINNIDWLEKKDTFKKYIENSKNDVDFGLRMNKILYELNNDHTQIIDQNQAVEMYITYYKMPENDWRHYISHVYEKENVRRRYNLDNKKINDYLKYNQYETKAKINKNNNILGKATENSNEIRTDNIEAKDINDKIGYLKINSMVNYDYSNYDQKKLKAYLKKAKNKKALV
ncbi:MAG: peptidase, partial [Anaerococcus vaginalis]|nr:peptidase [Anaerococcus vaginalis]